MAYRTARGRVVRARGLYPCAPPRGCAAEPRNADGGTPLLAAAAWPRGRCTLATGRWCTRRWLERRGPQRAARGGHARARALSECAPLGGCRRRWPVGCCARRPSRAHSTRLLRDTAIALCGSVGALLGSATNDSSCGASSAASAAASATASAAHPWTGQTPLHAAVYLRHQALIDLLLSHGAAHDERSRLQAVHRQWQDARAVAGAVAARSLADLSVQLDTVQEKKDEEDAAAAATAAAAAKLAGQGEARAQPEAETVGWPRVGCGGSRASSSSRRCLTAAVQTLRGAALATLRSVVTGLDRDPCEPGGRSPRASSRRCLSACTATCWTRYRQLSPLPLARPAERSPAGARERRTASARRCRTWHRRRAGRRTLAAVQISLGDTGRGARRCACGLRATTPSLCAWTRRASRSRRYAGAPWSSTRRISCTVEVDIRTSLRTKRTKQRWAASWSR